MLYAVDRVHADKIDREYNTGGISWLLISMISALTILAYGVRVIMHQKDNEIAVLRDEKSELYKMLHKEVG